jgi:putative spermidine/putrescine transport system permease protein
MTDARVVRGGPGRSAGWGRRLERWSWNLITGGLVGCGLLILLVPTLIAVAASFTGGETLRFPPQDLSLRWYRALVESSDDLEAAFLLSLRVSAVATLAAGVMASAAALALVRRKEAWARALEIFFQSPMMLPGVSLGLAMLVWLQMIGIPLSYWTLVIGHIAVATPYILRTALVGFSQIDPALLEASDSLGASNWTGFLRITLPLASPAIAAGSFIAFMFSFDNVPISLFLSDARSEVLPIRLWNLIESLLDVRAAAVSGALIITTCAIALIMEKLFGISKFIR